MSQSTVAIVGSGIAGVTVAYRLVNAGHDVEIFEKGPNYPYPHLPQFREQVLYQYTNPIYHLPTDLQQIVLSGNYPADPDEERYLGLGGSATHWGAITPRIPPPDFKTHTLYGYGVDWPLSYDDLEPYYCDAEHLIGVSGSDANNPFAPRRSRPYPLPPFALSYDDRVLAERLQARGILLQTIPQARTRLAYDDRPGCQNFGTCDVCPIGVRYSPTHHLIRAVRTGRCKVHLNASVRRVRVDERGRAQLIYQANDARTEQEHAAKIIIVAAGAIESARLLLLSSSDRHPDGLKLGDHVGRHLTFHHNWRGDLRYKENFFTGTTGAATAQTHQFIDPPGRGRYGGVRLEFDARGVFPALPFSEHTPREVIEELQVARRSRILRFHAESLESAKKFVALSDTRDRFGDPFPQVHYESSAFDHGTYGLVQQIFDKFASATGPEHAVLGGVDDGYFSGYHHMGTCRMGTDARESVVDQFGRVHAHPNVFVIGSSNFPSPGTVPPTLTITALALRTARYILDRL
ncbi:MAG TPA: GMC family oxidoreductase [bacterium]|nr:GMC family oxidoreductase [bacterium]